MTLDLVKDSISLAHWYALPETVNFCPNRKFLFEFELVTDRGKVLCSHSTLSVDSYIMYCTLVPFATYVYVYLVNVLLLILDE